MSHRPQRPGAELRLDDLLARLPSGVHEPTDSESRTRLERTLERVRSAQADSAIDIWLKTPLPVQPGEVEPSDPFGLASRDDAFDELRAPLKSGEHSPLQFETRGQSRPSPAVPSALPERSLRRSYWVTGAIGTLAAAAAAVLFLRHQPTPSERQAPNAGPNAELNAEMSVGAVAAPVQTGLQAEPPVAVAAAAPGEPPAMTTPPKTQDLPLEQPAIAAAAKPALPVARAAKAMAHTQPVAAAAANPAEPPLVPAAGPSNLADHPSTGELSAALARPKAEARRCLSAGSTVSVRVFFQSNGHVQRVEVAHSSLDAQARRCLEQVFATAHVEPFARNSFEVNTAISN